ncbi:MAG TPA: hypothetical protein VE669_08970 [Actinomycetota bacterium]|nr:hypothetical protein [Actinomycetota bacterium]
MLQVTDSAASAFRDILAKEDVPGNAIRLAPEMQADGKGGISLQAISEPAPTDSPAEAPGVQVVVAPELAASLDDAVLDARPTEQGAEFFLVPQGRPAS